MLGLPSELQESIKNSSLKPSPAEELLSIKNPQRQSQLGDMIVKRHLTTMKTRQLVKEYPYYCENSEFWKLDSELQSFNKAIVALRIAMSKIAAIPEDEEGGKKGGENLLVYEFLMHQKRLLHDQIDNIMNAKKIFGSRRIMNK